MTWETPHHRCDEICVVLLSACFSDVSISHESTTPERAYRLCDDDMVSRMGSIFLAFSLSLFHTPPPPPPHRLLPFLYLYFHLLLSSISLALIDVCVDIPFQRIHLKIYIFVKHWLYTEMLLLYNYLCSITENQNEEKQFSPNFLRSFGGSDPNIMCVRASESKQTNVP